MATRIIPKATALWLVILLLAFLNGGLRELVLIPAWGKTPGLLTSGLLLSAAVLLTSWIGAPWYGKLTETQSWRIGTYWLALTLAFEFGFGIVRGKPWKELLEAYAFKDGNIWTLVLLVILVAPTTAEVMRRKPETRTHA